MEITPIDELRKPHPDQKRIDAEAARLLLTTVTVYTGPRSKGRPSLERGEQLGVDGLIPRRR